MQKPQQQMAVCPFNKAHTFAKQKFVFHIDRCKDKAKVIHNFKKCQFNPFHYILKEQIQMHECCCPSRQQSIDMLKRLQTTYRRSIREPRQRSRQHDGKGSKQNKFEEVQRTKNEFHQTEQTLQECKQCQQILKTHYQRIIASNNQKLKKFLISYKELDNI